MEGEGHQNKGWWKPLVVQTLIFYFLVGDTGCLALHKLAFQSSGKKAVICDGCPTLNTWLYLMCFGHKCDTGQKNTDNLKKNKKEIICPVQSVFLHHDQSSQDKIYCMIKTI